MKCVFVHVLFCYNGTEEKLRGNYSMFRGFGLGFFYLRSVC